MERVAMQEQTWSGGHPRDRGMRSFTLSARVGVQADAGLPEATVVEAEAREGSDFHRQIPLSARARWEMQFSSPIFVE